MDPAFHLEAYHVSSRGDADEHVCEATVKVTVGGESAHTVADGDGPVECGRLIRAPSPVVELEGPALGGQLLHLCGLLEQVRQLLAVGAIGAAVPPSRSDLRSPTIRSCESWERICRVSPFSVIMEPWPKQPTW